MSSPENESPEEKRRRKQAPDYGQLEPELANLIELKRRSTEEIICLHLGMISASLASIANDLRIIRMAAEGEINDS